MTKLRAIIVGVGIALVLGAAAVYILPRPAQAEGRNDGTLTTTGCDSQECSFGDLAADAVQSAGGAQIAFVGAISLRPGKLDPGPLTKERLADLLANPDEVWAVSRLTGAQIKEALEYAVRTAPLPNNSFLQVAGVAFTYNPKAAQYQRVQSVTVGGAPISDAASYMVAMPLSLAKGGSGYFKIFTKETITRTGETSLSDAIVSFGSQRGSVSYTGPGRISAQ
jgi:5'-nucleotidase / UDP-sugar diphosphatase